MLHSYISNMQLSPSNTLALPPLPLPSSSNEWTKLNEIFLLQLQCVYNLCCSAEVFFSECRIIRDDWGHTWIPSILWTLKPSMASLELWSEDGGSEQAVAMVFSCIVVSLTWMVWVSMPLWHGSILVGTCFSKINPQVPVVPVLAHTVYVHIHTVKVEVYAGTVMVMEKGTCSIPLKENKSWVWIL